MAEERKEMLAIALANAKADLQTQIVQVANIHSRQNGPFELEIDLYEKRNRSVVGDNETLIGQIHSLIGTFDQQPSVQQAGVRVQRVAVIDSNGDGNAAVNVMFDHVGYT
jgi:hypothetical protein